MEAFLFSTSNRMIIANTGGKVDYSYLAVEGASSGNAAGGLFSAIIGNALSESRQNLKKGKLEKLSAEPFTQYLLKNT